MLAHAGDTTRWADVRLMWTGLASALAKADRLLGDLAEADTALERLVVARDGSWLRVDGQRIDLARRRAAPRLVSALVRARIERPGEALAPADLIAEGWPDEQILPEAAGNRLRVALSALRDLGLRDFLVKEADGYLLTPQRPVLWMHEPRADSSCAD
jgi:hypothetical protein